MNFSPHRNWFELSFVSSYVHTNPMDKCRIVFWALKEITKVSKTLLKGKCSLAHRRDPTASFSRLSVWFLFIFKMNEHYKECQYIKRRVMIVTFVDKCGFEKPASADNTSYLAVLFHSHLRLMCPHHKDSTCTDTFLKALTRLKCFISSQSYKRTLDSYSSNF